MKIVVLGGGVAGLAAAYRLSKAGHKVSVLEKKNELGGLLASIQVGSSWIEKYYHHFFSSDKTLMELITELELQNLVEWKDSSMAFFYKGKIHNLNSPMDVLRFKPLSVRGRFKFGWALLKLILRKESSGLKDVTVKDWATKNVGEEVYAKIFKPLLKIKYGKAADRASAAWLWGRINVRGKSRSRFASQEKLGYIKGGFQNVISALQLQIEQNRGDIQTGVDVKRIVIENQRVDSLIFVQNNKTKKLKVDKVVSTIPTPELIKICELPPHLQVKVEAIQYSCVICALIGLKKKLSDIYWLNIIDDLPIGGVIEHGNFVSPEIYGGHNLVYVFNYLDKGDPLWSLSDKEILDLYSETLMSMFKQIEKSDFTLWHIFRDPYSSPIYDISYPDLSLSMEQELKGLYISGMAKTFPTRGVDASLRDGILTAERIMSLKE